MKIFPAGATFHRRLQGHHREQRQLQALILRVELTGQQEEEELLVSYALVVWIWQLVAHVVEDGLKPQQQLRQLQQEPQQQQHLVILT